MHEEHHVGVLFDRTGFAQIRKLRLFILTHFGATVQLAQRHHRHFQFLGKQLQCTREIRHFLLTAFHGLAGSHELQVVDHDEFQIVRLLQSAAFRTDLHQTHVRTIVDE